MAAILACALAVASAQAPNTAHVRLHGQAGVLPLRLRSAVEAQDWAAAARFLHDAVEADPNGLIPVGDERYVSAAEYQRRAIGSWPAEGLAAVRELTDPAARNWLAAAREKQDRAPLRTLLARAPYSSVADEAMLLLGSLALHAGDAEEAYRTLARWYERCPDSPQALYGVARFAEACRAAGRADRLRELRAAALPAGTVLREGRAVTLPRLIEDWMAAAAAPPLSSTARDEWPQYGGAPGAPPLAPDRDELPSVQWSISLQGYPYDDQVRTSRLGQYPDEPVRSHTPAVRWFPAAAEGLVVVQDETSVQTLALYGRSAREIWPFPLPFPAGGTLLEEERTVHSPTVHGGRVYVPLTTAVGEHVMQDRWIPITYPMPHRALFCLDGVTGDEIWRVGGATSTGSIPEALSFALGPTVVGDDLYAGAVVQEHGTDPFRHYVVCLDADTGAFRWATYIAMGSTEQNLFGNSSRESAGTRVAVSGDLLLYGTNLGAAAALDRHSGEIRWLYRYSQWPLRPPPQLYPVPLPLCWWNNPPILADGRAILTPVDSPYLYVLDAATGDPAWRLAYTEARARYVYGLAGDLLVVGSSEVRGYRIGVSTPAWIYRPEDTVAYGMGAVGPHTLYVPTRLGLDLVDLDTLARRDRVRLDGFEEAGGTVIALDEAILAVHRAGLHVLSDPRRVEADVEAAARAQDLPADRLYEAALKSLAGRGTDTARGLLARVAAADPGGPYGRRAAHRLAVLEREEADRSAGRGDWRTALDRYQASLRWAEDIPVRLCLAEAMLQTGRPAEALEILHVLLQGSDDTRERAGGLIDRALRAHGGALYAPYEARAAQARAAAEVHRDAERLRLLVREFPHSVAAREALEGAIREAVRAGNPPEAMALLRLYLREIPSSPSMPQLLVDVASELERRSLTGAAEFVIRTLAARTPEASVQAEDHTARAGDWAEARLARAPYAETPGPNPGPDRLAPAGRVELEPSEAAGTILAPIGRATPALASIALLATGRTLRGLDTSVPAVRWNAALPAAPQWAALVDDRVVVGTARAVAGLSLGEGRVLWTVETGAWSDRAVVGSLVVGLVPGARESGGASILALDAFTGETAWRTQPGTGAGSVHGIAAVGRSHVAMLTSPPSRVGFLDAFTGQLLSASYAFREAGPSPRLYSAGGVAVLFHAREGAVAPAPVARGFTWRAPYVVRRGDAGGRTDVGSQFLVHVSELSTTHARFASVALRSGLLEAEQAIPAPGPVTALAVGPEWTVLVFEPDGAPVRLCAVGNVDGPILWNRALPPGEILLSAPRFAGDAVVVVSGRPARADRVEFRLTAWNREGEAAVEFAPDEPAGGLPSSGVAGGALLLSVQNHVEVWR